MFRGVDAVASNSYTPLLVVSSFYDIILYIRIIEWNKKNIMEFGVSDVSLPNQNSSVGENPDFLYSTNDNAKFASSEHFSEL